MFENSDQAREAFNKAAEVEFLKLRMATAAQAFWDQQKKEEEVLKVAGENGYEVIAIFENYAIAKVRIGHPRMEKLQEYPYTTAVKDEKGWRRTSHHFPSVEEAMLFMIGYKFEGSNTRFHQYAYRMLGKE